MKLTTAILVFASAGLCSCAVAGAQNPKGESGVRREGPASVPSPSAVGSELCTVQNDRLIRVSAHVDVESGDTILAGRSTRDWYRDEQGPFAGGKEWFQRNQPVVLNGRTFAKYALPRTLQPQDLIFATYFNDTPLFVEAGAGRDDPSVLYALVDAACNFQPYMFFAGRPVGDN